MVVVGSHDYGCRYMVRYDFDAMHWMPRNSQGSSRKITVRISGTIMGETDWM